MCPAVLSDRLFPDETGIPEEADFPVLAILFCCLRCHTFSSLRKLCMAERRLSRGR
jgi:hypothetical protein